MAAASRTTASVITSYSIHYTKLYDGLGREGSTHGIDEYLEIKAIHLGGIDR